jgi:hypothetical protein
MHRQDRSEKYILRRTMAFLLRETHPNQETFLDNVYLAVSSGEGNRTVRVRLASHSFAGRYHGQDSRD